MPGGRTFDYRVYRACERFSQPPSYADTLCPEELTKLIAFSEIRDSEEQEDLIARMKSNVRL